MEDDGGPGSTEALENRPSTRKSHGKATRRSARRRFRRGGQLVHHATEPFGRLLRSLFAREAQPSERPDSGTVQRAVPPAAWRLSVDGQYPGPRKT